MVSEMDMMFADIGKLLTAGSAFVLIVLFIQWLGQMVILSLNGYRAWMISPREQEFIENQRITDHNAIEATRPQEEK